MANKAAPLMSRRPKSREEAQREIESGKEFGDLEFRYDLDPVLSDDPMSRLGYSLSKDKSFYGDSEGTDGKPNELVDAPYHHPSTGEIYMDTKYGPSKDVWGHEYRHAGIKALNSLLESDENKFIDKYGYEAAALLRQFGNEAITELGDDPDASFNAPDDSTYGGKEYKKGDPVKIEHTVQDVSHGLLRAFRDTGRIPEDAPNARLITKGMVGLRSAAMDLLEATGEPAQYQKHGTGPSTRPKVQPQKEDEGWFRSVLKKMGFAEGGMTMGNQMKTLMAEGGLKDDGMDRDPVSGNEVPPGSMANEVRDDIDARLSEGEYVVPADVVRFFGVKFFEELRSQAKEGLTDMAENDRIGGEPVEDEIMPEDMQMQMAMGGVVPTADNVTVPTVKPAQQMSVKPVVGYAPGGDVTNPYLNDKGNMDYEKVVKEASGNMYLQTPYNTLEDLFADFRRVGSYTAGKAPSQQQQQGLGNIEYISYTGPNGEIMMIPFRDGEPMTDIPEGFTPSDAVTPEVVTPTTTTPTYTTDRGEGRDGEPESGMANMSLDALESQLESLQNGTGASFAITNAISNSILGKAIEAFTGKSLVQNTIEQLQNEISSRSTDSISPNKGMTKETVMPDGTKATTQFDVTKTVAGTNKTGAGIKEARQMTPAQIQAGIEYAAEGDARDTSWGGGYEKGGGEVTSASDVSHTAESAQEAAAAAGWSGGARGGRATGGLMTKGGVTPQKTEQKKTTRRRRKTTK